jgi:AcrR family transcriptional regulator
MRTMVMVETEQIQPMKESTDKHEHRGDVRREQILQAAWVALARDGYEKITTRRIAEEAGVNIATLHYYYGTKEALLSEAVRHAVRWSEEMLSEATDRAPNAVEALKTGLKLSLNMIQGHEENPDRPVIIRYDLIVRGFREPSAKQQALHIYETYYALVKKVAERHLAEGGQLVDGITPEDFAYYVVSAADGATIAFTLSGNRVAAERSFALILRHALDLMKQP